MKYGYTKKVSLSFEEAIDEITLSLGEQGFGVLTKIDMQAAMKKKIDKDIESYMILGACNPTLAYEALCSEQEIGLVLPCNIIVYKLSGEVFVSTILPTAGIGFVENAIVSDIAQRAEEKLKKSIDNL